MCRAGGRRCPSHLSNLAREARNAKRRANHTEGRIIRLKERSDKAFAEDKEALGATLIAEQESLITKEKEERQTSEDLQQQYVDSIAENALISDKQEAAAAHAEESHPEVGGNALKESISALPEVFGGTGYKDISGKELFHDTDEITSSNPELGVYKTRNTGALADLRYFNPETIRGKIVKSKLNENSAHEDFGFRKFDRNTREYEIISFNDVGENKHEGAEEEESRISAAELNSLQIEEKASLRKYTGIGYTGINGALYRNDEGKAYAPERKVPRALQGDISRIDSALDKGPKRQRYTYRSVTEISDAMAGYSSPNEWVKEKFPMGEDVVFGGYQSSSSEKAGVQDFSFHNAVVFEILTPEGANITSASGHRVECETLLPRDARYKVVGVEDDVTVKFDKVGYQKYGRNILVRLVAVNSKGEILDGTNADEASPVEYEE